jgi:hypothetical protein
VPNIKFRTCTTPTIDNDASKRISLHFCSRKETTAGTLLHVEQARMQGNASISTATRMLSRKAEDGPSDPFGSELKYSRIYGRGACDMNGGDTTSIIAAETFIELYKDFAGSIEISGTADQCHFQATALCATWALS